MTDVPRTSNILFALLLALAGCSVHLESQEIWCRRPDDSSLEFLLIYKGVYAPPGSSIFLLPDSEGNRPTNLEHAVSVADDFQQGRRIGMIGNPFLQFDLDAEVGRKDHPEKLLIALDNIVLATHGAFLDEQQRLCAYQLYRIDRVDRLVEAIDDAYRRVCLRDLERGEEHLSKLGLSDAGTIASWKRFVESGRRWLSYESGRLEICVPISAERPNELLRSGLAELLAPANLERLSTRAKTQPEAHAEMSFSPTSRRCMSRLSRSRCPSTSRKARHFARSTWRRMDRSTTITSGRRWSRRASISPTRPPLTTFEA